MAVTLKITGIDDQIRRIQKMANFDLNMKEIAERGLSDVSDHFVEERGPKSAWAATKRGGQILRDTGHLFQSLDSKYDKRTATVYTIVKYAAVHNFGSTKKKIKQRKFMWLSKRALDGIKKMLTKTIVESAK